MTAVAVHAPATVAAVVAATTAAQVAGAMGAAVFPVIAPELARTLEVEASMIGYQMSLIYAAAMLGSMLFTGLVARYGACRTTQIGMVCCIIGLAIGFHSSIAALAVTSVFIGVSMSINLPAAAHLLLRFSPPQHRNFIFSLKQTGVPLAWALMAGATYNITSSTMLDINYRYLNIGSTSANLNGGAVASKLSIGEIGEHQLRAGLRWDIE